MENELKKPVVSIVGRPNVGKSTLFNRIIGRREAIVDDAPGITRDRKTADGEWNGVLFTLVDTGGYIPKSRDVIETGVKKQVELAIEESDVIILLVDCTTGIMYMDSEVARVLRKSGKPVLLVANKVDHAGREYGIAEFMRLGLGEPVGISAIGGRAIGDLLDRVVELTGGTGKEYKETDQDAVQLAVVGKPNVGKSTFINRILQEERLLVTEIPGTTRDSVDVRIRYQKQDMILIDTAGMRRPSKVQEKVEYYSTVRSREAIERCNVACVFINADEGMTQQDMRVIRTVTEARKGIILVVNKWDLIQGNEEAISRLDETVGSKLQGMNYIPVIHVSCTTGFQVHKVLEMAWKTAREREKRIPSPELNKFITALNRKIQPPAVQGKKVRILFGTQVGIRPPSFVFFATNPNLILTSYKKFLENQLREEFGFEGVPVSFGFKQK